MRIENLPSPGILAMGVRLRQEATKAISAVEIQAARTPGGEPASAKQLHDFFVACADAVAPYVAP